MHQVTAKYPADKMGNGRSNVSSPFFCFYFLINELKYSVLFFNLYGKYFRS